MKVITQLMVGLLSALGMVVFVFGALLLSLSEDTSFAMAVNSNTPETANPTSAITPVTPPPGITLVVSLPSATPSITAPVSTICPPPPGWRLYTIMAGDTLDALAVEAGLPVEDLIEENCIIRPILLPGTLLYLPPIPTATPTSVPPSITPTSTAVSTATNTPKPSCGPYRGWVLYTVQPGDTLYRLGEAFGVSVPQLRFANCLSGDLIQEGSRIYVPNVPTRTPVKVATPTPTISQTPVPPSLTPTEETITPITSDTVAPTTVTVEPTTETVEPTTETVAPTSETPADTTEPAGPIPTIPTIPTVPTTDTSTKP